MTHLFDRLRSLRWFVIDHMLFIILVLMIATVIGVLFVQTRAELARDRVELQRSIN